MLISFICIKQGLFRLFQVLVVADPLQNSNDREKGAARAITSSSGGVKTNTCSYPPAAGDPTARAV